MRGRNPPDYDAIVWKPGDKHPTASDTVFRYGRKTTRLAMIRRFRRVSRANLHHVEVAVDCRRLVTRETHSLNLSSGLTLTKCHCFPPHF